MIKSRSSSRAYPKKQSKRFRIRLSKKRQLTPLKRKENKQIKREILSFARLKPSTLQDIERRLMLLLKGLGQSPEERKKRLKQLFPKEELQKLLSQLEEGIKEEVREQGIDRRVFSEASERLDRFSKIFPEGENSWGFAHAADHEDIVDRREIAKRMPERQLLINWRINLLLALYRTYTYGDPKNDFFELDSFEKRIRDLCKI